MRHHSAHVRNIAQMKRRKERGKRRPTISDLRKKMRDTMDVTTDSIDNLFDDENEDDDEEYEDREYQSFNPLSTGESNFFPSSSSNTPQQIIRSSQGSSSEQKITSISVSSVGLGSKSSRSSSVRSRGYKPKTLAQYRKYKKSLSSEPLGKLQPDLNRPELLRKRAKKERVRAFSERLRQVNTSTLRSRRTETEQKRQQKSREEEERKQPSARERALEFAKTIPKPKMRPSVPDATSYDDISDDTSSLAAPAPSRLDILRARHRELQAKVDFARNSIGL